jgi:hypothetical protein
MIVSVGCPSIAPATFVLASPHPLGRNISTPPMIRTLLWSSSSVMKVSNLSSSSFTWLVVPHEYSYGWDPYSISSSFVNTPCWHELLSDLISPPLPTWKFGTSPLPPWQFTRSSDLFTLPTSKPMRFLQDLFTSSLSFSSCLNHLYNTCCWFQANKFRIGHLVVLFRGHLYLQHTFSSCCIFNASVSI